jgi:hypothetical protein
MTEYDRVAVLNAIKRRLRRDSTLSSHYDRLQAHLLLDYGYPAHEVDKARDLGLINGELEVVHPFKLGVAPTKIPCDKCGRLFPMDELLQIQVSATPGSHGDEPITKGFCEPCFEAVVETLRDLGFMDHVHGGINFWEDATCPGTTRMEDCPEKPDEDYY